MLIVDRTQRITSLRKSEKNELHKS